MRDEHIREREREREIKKKENAQNCSIGNCVEGEKVFSPSFCFLLLYCSVMVGC